MEPADTAPTFDTLAAVRRLESAGVNRPQAEAHADVIRDSRDGLATKADIARLEEKMATRVDLYRALWMQTGVIVGAVTAVSAIAKPFG